MILIEKRKFSLSDLSLLFPNVRLIGVKTFIIGDKM